MKFKNIFFRVIFILTFCILCTTIALLIGTHIISTASGKMDRGFDGLNFALYAFFISLIISVYLAFKLKYKTIVKANYYVIGIFLLEIIFISLANAFDWI